MAHATLSLAAGLLVAAVPDAAGEGHAYRLTRDPPGLDLEAWRFARADGGGSYRVAFDGRSWRCDCPAWRYRRGPRGEPRSCKHCLALADALTIKELLG